jgi:hypothetical protein
VDGVDAGGVGYVGGGDGGGGSWRWRCPVSRLVAVAAVVVGFPALVGEDERGGSEHGAGEKSD